MLVNKNVYVHVRSQCINRILGEQPKTYYVERLTKGAVALPKFYGAKKTKLLLVLKTKNYCLSLVV